MSARFVEEGSPDVTGPNQGADYAPRFTLTVFIENLVSSSMQAISLLSNTRTGSKASFKTVLSAGSRVRRWMDTLPRQATGQLQAERMFLGRMWRSLIIPWLPCLLLALARVLARNTQQIYQPCPRCTLRQLFIICSGRRYVTRCRGPMIRKAFFN